MLTIITPTYNEKENIEPLLRKIKSVLKNKKFEVLIADSKSRDGTQEETRRVAVSYKVNAKLVSTGNTDLSNAVVVALKKAKGDIVCVIDADLQHPPEAILLMLKKISEGADFVNASRFMPGAKLEFGMSRDIISKGFQLLTRISVPRARKLTDTASGFFMFKKEVIKNSFLKPIGYKIMLEVLAKGKINKVSEVPIHFRKRERGKSKLNMKQIFLASRHLLRLFRYRIIKN
jgi:dolichol-phosphate mannosyltransferase